MLVIDSEGLGSVEVNKNQDSMIVLLSMLISSYFIYNTVGTIDENSFNELSYFYFNIEQSLIWLKKWTIITNFLNFYG